MLTKATLVPKILAEVQVRKNEYGSPQDVSGSVASMVPIPGTMTTSCRLTHADVRKTSIPFPRLLSRMARSPVAVFS